MGEDVDDESSHQLAAEQDGEGVARDDRTPDLGFYPIHAPCTKFLFSSSLSL